VTLSEILQFANLILVPILVYVIKFERKLAVLETTRDEMYRRLSMIDGDIKAVHKRMDHFQIPHASSRST